MEDKLLQNDLNKKPFISLDDGYEIDSIVIKKVPAKKNTDESDPVRTPKVKVAFKLLLLYIWRVLKYVAPYIIKWVVDGFMDNHVWLYYKK